MINFRTALAAALLALAAPFAAAGEPAIEWMRQIGPLGPAQDFPSDIATHDGAIYAAGVTAGELVAGSDLPQVDSYLRRYDPDGNIVWTLQFGSEEADWATAVAADASGIYVTGTSRYVRWLRKFNSAGEEIWNVDLGLPPTTLLRDVAVDATGVYVCGDTTGPLPGYPDPVASDLFLVKRDKDGNPLWARQLGNGAGIGVRGMATGGSGVYVTGSTVGTFPGQTKAGFWGSDAFLLKFDSDGAEVWVRQFGHSFWGAEAATVFADASGAYVAGASIGTLTSEPKSGTDRDAWVRRYDADANVVWTQMFGTALNDWPAGVSANASGVFVCGQTDAGFAGQTHVGGHDAFVQKLDLNGNEVWVRQFGTPDSDIARGVAADGTRIHVTGSFGGKRTSLTADVRVQAFDVDGNELWSDEIATETTYEDAAQDVDANGNIYVAGRTRGLFPGETFTENDAAFLQKRDASGTEIWTRQFGTVHGTRATGVAVAASGIYIAGWTRSELGSPPGTGQQLGFLRKYDTDGNVLWTVHIDPNPNQNVRVAADASGVYVALVATQAFPGQTHYGGYDVVVRKYGHDGTEAWTVQFGTDALDSPLGISASASGVYVSGLSLGPDPQAGTAFVRKFDNDGNESWNRYFEVSRTYAYSVRADGSGVYVAGMVLGEIPGQTVLGNRDAFVRRYDAAGNALWTRQFGTAGVDYGLAVTADDSGVYVGGYTYGHFPGYENAGGKDAFVTKFDPDGNEIWNFQFGTNDDDQVLGLAAAVDGVIAVGDTFGTFEGEPTVDRQRDGFVTRIIELAPVIEVAPLAFDFGDVEVDRTSTTIVTLQNLGNADLTVSGLSLATGTRYSISSAPATPFVVAPAGTVDVEVTFAPLELGATADELRIASDDDERPLVTVALNGNGVALPPEEHLSDILDQFDQGVADGTLVAEGPAQRLQAFRRMLVAAGTQVANGSTQSAIQILTIAYSRVDGEPQPPDFLTGPEAEALAATILELIAKLEEQDGG